MPLTPAQIQAIEARLRKGCPNHSCPACGARHWSIGGVVGLPETDPDATDHQPTRDLFPTILRVCNSCGYTLPTLRCNACCRLARCSSSRSKAQAAGRQEDSPCGGATCSQC